MKDKDTVKAKSETIRKHIESVLANIAATASKALVKGPFYSNRSVQRDNRRDDWRASYTKPSLEVRRSKRHKASKAARIARRNNW